MHIIGLIELDPLSSHILEFFKYNDTLCIIRYQQQAVSACWVSKARSIPSRAIGVVVAFEKYRTLRILLEYYKNIIKQTALL